MMAMFGTAHERTEAAFRNLLVENGLAFQRLISTASQVSVIESIAA